MSVTERELNKKGVKYNKNDNGDISIIVGDECIYCFVAKHKLPDVGVKQFFKTGVPDDTCKIHIEVFEDIKKIFG